MYLARLFQIAFSTHDFGGPQLPGEGTDFFFGVDEALTSHDDPAEFATKIIDYFLGFAGAIAVIMLIIGGFMYLTAAGNDERAKKGLHTIVYALIGIVILSMSYIVVTTIITALASATAS